MDSQTLFSRLMELIDTKTVDLEKIKKAILIKNDQLPRYLYKYRTIDEEGHALDNLRNSTLWLSPAHKLNDPYDSAALSDPYDGFNMAEEILKRSDRSEARINEILATQDPLDAILHDIFEANKDTLDLSEAAPQIEKTKGVITQFFDDHKNSLIESFSTMVQRCVHICSLSERLDSLPLWAHYANNHKGFAMEYDLHRCPPDDFIRRWLWPVSYSGIYDSRKVHSRLLKEKVYNNLIPTIAALHKSPDWSYEKEWRIVLQAGFVSNGLSVHAPLNAVYLGANTQAAHAQQIIEAATIAKVPVFKMRNAPHRFCMEAVPLD